MLAREIEGARGRVDVDTARGASGQRGDGERARVGEEVEDGLAAGERAQAGAVVALVEKEAGLLAPGDVGEKVQAVLEKGDAGPLTPPLSRRERVALIAG